MTDYEKIEGVNWSTMKHLIPEQGETVPRFAEYDWALSHPLEDTDPMKLGRATHCAVFEPDEYPVRFAVWTGGIRRGKEWDAFLAANEDKTSLTQDQHRIACGIRDSVRSHPVASKYLEAGKAELPLEWTDARTAIKCKARADFLGNALLDLKTTSHGIGPKSFATTCANQHYHGQLAHYRAGAVASGLAKPDTPCVLIAVATQAPFTVWVHELDEDTMWRADGLVEWCLSAVLTYRELKRTGTIPPPCKEPNKLALPGWYRQPNEDDNEGGWPRGLELPEEAA